MSHAHGPAPEREIVRRFHESGGSPPGRDTTPAVGTRGQPGAWRRAVEGAAVALARAGFQDARWSYLYKDDTRYRERAGTDGLAARAARLMRGGAELPYAVQGTFYNQVL